MINSSSSPGQVSRAFLQPFVLETIAMTDTKLNRDGSVRVWNCVEGHWQVLEDLADLTDCLSATLSREERTAVREHLTRHGRDVRRHDRPN
jgi:hypothetical protein